MIPLMKNTFLKEHETKKALADFLLHTVRLSMGEKCLEAGILKIVNRRAHRKNKRLDNHRK